MSDKIESATPEEVALAHCYRRWLLYCLFTYANPMRLPDIAHQLTIWERWDGEEDPLRNRLTIYNALYHDHLPAMCEANLVTYHQRDDEVELGPAAAQVKPPIQHELENELDALLVAEGAAIHAGDATE